MEAHWLKNKEGEKQEMVQKFTKKIQVIECHHKIISPCCHLGPLLKHMHYKVLPH